MKITLKGKISAALFAGLISIITISYIVINIVLNNNVNYISPIYNYQYSLSRIFNKGCACKKLNNDVIIYHFIGSDKPWHTWVQYIDIVKEYIYIYIESPFGIILCLYLLMI